MEIMKVNLIYFSPTGTTRKVLQSLASGISTDEAPHIDLTYPKNQLAHKIPSGELAIIGVPVYAGRVAPVAAERLKRIEGKGAPAVIVVVYGNREYEDALIELKQIAEDSGFRPIAACTFIGEHSFSEEKNEIAHGRPDIEDSRTAKQYGKQIFNSLRDIQVLEEIGQLEVPGDIPYKEGMGSLPFSPSVNVELCSQCGECIPVCPTGAITLENVVEIDIETCIFCCSCKKSCPEAVIAIEAPPIKEKMVWLSQNCSYRKDPQLFLPY